MLAEQLSASLLRLVRQRSGHFRLESGHHADAWLELDSVFLRPIDLQPYVIALAGRLEPYDIDTVIGPLTGGAFLAQMLAVQLRKGFAFAERITSERAGIHPVDYRIPQPLRAALRGRRVAVVDDAISAGSAAGGTLKDLHACQAESVVIAALILLGEGPGKLAAQLNLPLEALVERPLKIWEPAECPMCAAGTPIS